MGGDVTKRPVAVVLGITADMAFAAANVLLGLERFPPADGYDVVIFHNGVPAGDLALLARLRDCHFVAYRCAESIRRNIPAHALRAFSEIVYAKYECFELLNRYSRVIWLDTDILIRGDTAELLERGASGAAFCARGQAAALQLQPGHRRLRHGPPVLQRGCVRAVRRFAGPGERQGLAARRHRAPCGPGDHGRSGHPEPVVAAPACGAGGTVARIQRVPAPSRRSAGAHRARGWSSQAVDGFCRSAVERGLRALAGAGRLAVPGMEDRTVHGGSSPAPAATPPGDPFAYGADPALPAAAPSPGAHGPGCLAQRLSRGRPRRCVPLARAPWRSPGSKRREALRPAPWRRRSRPEWLRATGQLRAHAARRPRNGMPSVAAPTATPPRRVARTGSPAVPRTARPRPVVREPLRPGCRW
ncbi:MAG: hypothetical protein IPM40_14475 [Gammaproteobacteria bacterium]|nr:hypothetical protein [Gammaproteobacteria bacterium]